MQGFPLCRVQEGGRVSDQDRHHRHHCHHHDQAAVHLLWRGRWGHIQHSRDTRCMLPLSDRWALGWHDDVWFLKYSIQKSSNRNRSLLLPETSPLCCLHKRSHLKGRKMFPVYKINMPGYISNFLFDGHNKQDMGKDMKVQNKNWRGFTQNDMRCAPESQHIL